MKRAKLSDILGIINKLAPSRLAESWDNSGLQAGDQTSEIFRIMLALEPSLDVINSAINSRCQLLITHHPLIFKPLSSISTSTNSGLSLHTAIKAGLALLCMHTNYDIVRDGLNDILCEKIGVIETVPLKPIFFQELVKLVLFVPESHKDQLLHELSPYIEASGNYRDCTFSTTGTGTFTPLQGSKPYIGAVGVREIVQEERLEILLDKSNIARAVKRLRSIHPYEEPAFDIYPTLNQGVVDGMGRVGKLAAPSTVSDYAKLVGGRLNTPVRYVGNPEAAVRKVAVCSGSGASLMHDAIRVGADLLVTGDIKYHEAQEAKVRGLAIIDAGHFPTEIIMAAAIKEQLQSELDVRGYDAEVVTCDLESDPFIFIIP